MYKITILFALLAFASCKKKETEYCWKCSNMSTVRVGGIWQKATYTYFDTCGLTERERRDFMTSSTRLTDSTQSGVHCDKK